MKLSEQRKNITDELAKMLPAKSELEEERILKLLKELGYEQEEKKPVENVDYFPKGNIGIYKPETRDGQTVYSRDQAFRDRWTYFADVPTIPPKSDKKRIVYLGESAARGFLLDPEYTPALVLEKLINANASDDQFEVIDLAETNLTLDGVTHRFLQCVDLEPDMVVFLGGNNWIFDYISVIASDTEALASIEKSLETTGHIGDLKPILEKKLEELIVGFMRLVDKTSKAHDFSVIMAVTEFNLLDCRSTAGEKLITHLPKDGIDKWTTARANALKAQEEGDLEQMFINAQAMIDLDSTHPLGYELLADANIARGDYDQARELLEQGRDTAMFWRSNSKPRMLQVVRRTTLKMAEELNIKSLDTPEVFKQHLNGKIPGRDMFLDYCHFTAEGIQVIAEPLSRQVLELFDNHDKRILKASDVKPERHTVAMGHLFAAIHNVHWGQSYPILKHHCVEALKASKDVSKIMVYYCDMITRSVSNNLTKSLEQILGNKIQIARYGHALMHPKDLKNMELDLVRAMVESLRDAGVNITRYVDELRNAEHGVNGRTIDLLKSFYHATSYDEYQGSRPAFFQARDHHSKFFIVAEKDTSFDLSVSLRVPKAPLTTDKIEFILNGKKVAAIVANTNWTNHSLHIPGEYSNNGVNELVVSWPTPAEVGKPESDTKDILKSFYYVFGDISHFSATGVKEVLTPEMVEKEVGTVS